MCLCMTTLTEGFLCFFLSCKAKAGVKPQRRGTACTLPNFCVVCIICFVSFSVLFVCICVLYFCHRVTTQLQFNISYHIKSPRGPGPPHCRCFISCSDTPHAVGLLCTSDEPDAETSTRQHTTPASDR